MRTLLASICRDAVRSSFVTGACWSIAGAMMGRSMTLLSTIISARLLGNAGYGRLGMVQSTLVLFGAFAGSGLGLSLTRHIAQLRDTDPKRMEHSIALGFLMAVVAGSLVACLLFLLSDRIARTMLNASDLALELKIGTALVLLTVITGTQAGTMAGLQEFRLLAITNMSRAGCVAVALVSGSLYGVTGAVIGLVGAEAICMILNEVVLMKTCQRSFLFLPYRHFDWRELRALCAFALPVLLSGLIMQPAQWFSNAVLANQPSGYSRLGIFIAAEKLRELVLFVPSSISQTMLSFLSNLHGTNNTQGYTALFRVNLLVHLGLVVVPAIGLILLSRQVMRLYGLEFQEGWITVSILAASAVPFVFNNVLGQVLQSRGLIWYRFGLDVLLASLFAVLAMGLIPLYRENGLALAHLLAFSVIASALFLIVRRAVRVKISASNA